MTDGSADALAEYSQAIAHDILTLPDLSDPEWDTFAMVAEVTDSMVRMTGYRYPAEGPPVPTRTPTGSPAFRELHERTRGADGQGWDVVIVKIHRDTAGLVLTFFSGADADAWRVTPQNIDNLPEALRPTADDFSDRTPGL